MQVFLLVAFLLGLSSKINAGLTYEYSTIYPLRATAVLHGETKDSLTNQTYSIAGKVSFDQYDVVGNVTVTVDISGLPPHSNETGLWRGLHIHTYGILNNTVDVKSACASTGPHYNPFNVTHGSDNSTVRHIGDLGNVLTFSNGTIRQVYNVSGLDMYGPFSIVGRSVVLHELMDDYGLAGTDLSLSAGSSGARIACGVIGWDKSVSGAVENGFITAYALYANLTGLNTTLNDLKESLYMGFEETSKNVSAVLNQSRLVDLVKSYFGSLIEGDNLAMGRSVQKPVLKQAVSVEEPTVFVQEPVVSVQKPIVSDNVFTPKRIV